MAKPKIHRAWGMWNSFMGGGFFGCMAGTIVTVALTVGLTSSSIIWMPAAMGIFTAVMLTGVFTYTLDLADKAIGAYQEKQNQKTPKIDDTQPVKAKKLSKIRSARTKTATTVIASGAAVVLMGTAALSPSVMATPTPTPDSHVYIPSESDEQQSVPSENIPENTSENTSENSNNTNEQDNSEVFIPGKYVLVELPNPSWYSSCDQRTSYYEFFSNGKAFFICMQDGAERPNGSRNFSYKVETENLSRCPPYDDGVECVLSASLREAASNFYKEQGFGAFQNTDSGESFYYRYDSAGGVNATFKLENPSNSSSSSGNSSSGSSSSGSSSSSSLTIPSCPGSLRTQIDRLGVTIRVTTNGLVPKLGIRPEPTLESHKMYTLPSGTQMTVLDGPICSDNSYFWFVNTSNGKGWVREGNTEFYFIDPVN